MSEITGFHAHVYFDESTVEQATSLCTEASGRFPITMGRVHRKPVGPHPCWSCQLAFAPEAFGEIVPWIALKREQLVVFIHPLTGDDIADHTAHAIWMGRVETLDLSVLE